MIPPYFNLGIIPISSAFVIIHRQTNGYKNSLNNYCSFSVNPISAGKALTKAAISVAKLLLILFFLKTRRTKHIHSMKIAVIDPQVTPNLGT